MEALRVNDILLIQIYTSLNNATALTTTIDSYDNAINEMKWNEKKNE